MTTRTERFHDIDGTRGLLMVLGVFFHAALIYQSGLFHDQFIVILQDVSWSPIWDWPILFSNLMRMPSFYIISGFLMGLALAKYPVESVLGKRLVRLVVPLVTAALLLIPLQGWVLNHASGGQGWPWTPYLTEQPYDPYSYNASISYLWFLVNLTVYMILVSAWWMVRHVGPERLRRLARLDGTWWTGPVGWIAMACVIVACRIADRILIAQAIIQYAPFFFIGVWLSFNVGRYRSFSTLSWLRLSLAGGAFAAFGFLAAAEDPPTWQRLCKRGLEAFAAVGLSSQVLGLGRWLFRHPIPALRNLSDASYTIYLLHQPLLLWSAWQLRAFAWHPLLKFAVVSLSVTLLTYYCHRYMVSRHAGLALLLNGRLPSAPRGSNLGSAAHENQPTAVATRSEPTG